MLSKKLSLTQVFFRYFRNTFKVSFEVAVIKALIGSFSSNRLDMEKDEAVNY